MVEIFKTIWLIVGGLFGLAMILAIIETFIEKITAPRRRKKAEEKLKKDINEFVDMLEKIQKETKKEETKKPRRGRPKKESTK